MSLSQKDKSYRIHSQEALEKSDPQVWRGGEGLCIAGQSPVWEDEHVLGTDGGTAVQPRECA